MSCTRKNRRGGGLKNLLMGKSQNAPQGPSLSILQARRNSNLKHSKFRVANVLSVPGQSKYTNKERISAEYEKAVEHLRSLEQPVETAQAMKGFSDKLKAALESEEARMAGAVTITLPFGAAQLLMKALRVFLAALVFLFWDIPSMGTIPLSAYIMPNRGFNTTAKIYNAAKGLTGVGTTGVKNWSR